MNTYPSMPKIERPKKVLVSWEINPGYTPPFKLSSNQINVCRVQAGKMSLFSEGEYKISAWTPEGDYDLFELLKHNNIDTNFDLVVVWSSSAKSHKGFYNQPINLHKFNCKKLLVLGDTHHMDGPISSMLQYCENEAFTHITTMYDRQHLHFFEKTKFDPKIAWFPVASVVERRSHVQHNRRFRVSLLGNYGSAHAYRKKIIQTLEKKPINLICGVRSNSEAFNIFSSSLINLNVSLNGDFNLRTHEILMSGGFLLTDQLSEESGFNILLRDGEECVTYESIRDLNEKLEYYLSHPKLTSEISRNGQIVYASKLRPEISLNKMMKWVFSDEVEFTNQVFEDARHQHEREIVNESFLQKIERVKFYEDYQEINRLSTDQIINLGPEINPLNLIDIIDLNRVKIKISRFDNHKLKLLNKLQYLDRVNFYD
jgi:hypothetical protein